MWFGVYPAVCAEALLGSKAAPLACFGGAPHLGRDGPRIKSGVTSAYWKGLRSGNQICTRMDSGSNGMPWLAGRTFTVEPGAACTDRKTHERHQQCLNSKSMA